MARPTTTPEPNNAQLSQACDMAFAKFQTRLTKLRTKYEGNADAKNAFDELEGFLSPLFTTLSEQMKTADSIDAQKTLVLQMMRASFNEVMMVACNDDIAQATNSYIRDMIDAYTQQVDHGTESGHAGKLGRLKDPGGTFQAIQDYMGCLNAASDAIEFNVALDVRRLHGIPIGPVTPEQHALIRKESETALRELGEPLIDKNTPFQPDMLGIVVSLMMGPEHMHELMQAHAQGSAAMPGSTVRKWQNLQRDYPDMATDPQAVVHAMVASLGRGRATLN